MNLFVRVLGYSFLHSHQGICSAVGHVAREGETGTMQVVIAGLCVVSLAFCDNLSAVTFDFCGCVGYVRCW